MARVITALNCNFPFELRQSPPIYSVQFTDVDDVTEKETHSGLVQITDAAAARIAAVKGTLFDVLDQVVIELEALEASIAEPGSVAERLTMAENAKREYLAASATRDALMAESADLDKQIAEKRAAIEAIASTLPI